MNTKHTPGPWMVATSNSWRRIISESGTPVCEPTVQRDGHPDLSFPNGGQDGPDARLIAAAPELLEALATAMEWIDAVPKSTVLPSMPGFDRDWVDELLARTGNGGEA